MTLLYHESRKARGSVGEGLTVTSVYRCVPYTDYPAALAQMLGGVRLIGRRLVRRLPLRDSIHPWLFCQEVEVDGVGNFLNMPAAVPNLMLRARNFYDQGARLTATFKPYSNQDSKTADDAQGPQAQEQQEMDLAEESMDFGGQALTLPNKYYRWLNADPTAIPLANQQINATKLMPQIEYVLTRHYCLTLSTDAIVKLYGRVNKSAITFGKRRKRTWPKECLRFDGLQESRKITTTDLAYHNLTYKWSVRPIYDVIWVGPTDGDVATDYVGWNRLFNPAKNRWEYVVLAADPTAKIYQPDEDITQAVGPGGATVKGFALLFHPGAT